eukprot:TRINITY_DN27678_c0_g1_i1.p1 TRINITY_DN27678_c0_g1~~TRINITY_DN27678_c0_g1_i1.p1  ORF type:complete len:1011 (+),score=331.96 TRINITY_DN27678_c0_g1_i1:186-3218(+)
MGTFTDDLARAESGQNNSPTSSEVLRKVESENGNVRLKGTETQPVHGAEAAKARPASKKRFSTSFASMTIGTYKGTTQGRDDDAASVTASEATSITMSPVARYEGPAAPSPSPYDQHPVAEFWIRFLMNHKRPTASVWVILSIIAVFGAVRLVDNTTVDIEAPRGTDAYRAKEELEIAFPEFSESSTFVLLISKTEGGPIVPDARLDSILSTLRTNIETAWTKPNFIQSMHDYYNYTQGGMTALAAHRISKNGNYTIVTISIQAAVKSSEAAEFSDYLKAIRYDGFTVVLIGAPVFEEQAERAASDDLIHLLSAVTPITLVVMAFLLRSLRLILIGAVCLFVCSSISLGICWMISLSQSVSTMTPPLLLASVIGTSVCYTLILLHRYREALLERRRNGLSLDKAYATKQALVHAGEAIIVSGVTLVVCFLGLTIYPMASIRTFGVSCAVGVSLVVLCSLSLSPLMLLVFRLWEGAVQESKWWDRWDDLWHFTCVKNIHNSRLFAKEKPAGSEALHSEGRKQTASGSRGRGASQAAVEDYDSDWNDSFREVVPHDKRAGAHAAHNSLILKSDGVNEMSIWLLIARITTKYPISLIVVLVVIGAISPLAVRSTKFEVTADTMSLVPHNSAVLKGYNTLGAQFAYGEVYPYRIVMKAREGLVTSPENWEASAQFLWTLGHAVNNSDAPEFNNLNYIDSASITLGHQGKVNNLEDAKDCVAKKAQGLPATGDCPRLLHAWDYVSADEQYMGALFTSPEKPMTSKGKEWLEAARDLHDDSFEIFISGEPADVIDSMDGVYSSIGLMLGVTCFAVIIFNLIVFKSVLIPLRALGTRAVTVAVVYGAATIVYCDNDFSWSQPLSSKTQEISYVVVLIALPILVGMGLGPDFLLVTRIIEIRKSSVDLPEYITDPTRRAVVLGVTRTGDIISASGVVMAVCFAMLLVFSEVAIQNQMAFILTLGAFFETFVTRTFLIGPVMALLGRVSQEANWWPFALHNWNKVSDVCRGRTYEVMDN